MLVKNKIQKMKHLKTFNENLEDTDKWAIFAGLGGGFGGANFKEIFMGSKEDAESVAYEFASLDYDQYDGMHGLRSISDIMEEDGVEEDEAEEIYNEEREGWLEYYVEPYDPTKDYD